MSGALQMVNMMAGQGLDEEEIHSRLDNLRAVTTSVRETFQDASKTTFVCVCIPEFLSVYETERLVQELVKQGIDCSNIVVNQVLFPICDGDDSSFPLPECLTLDEIGSVPSSDRLSEENRLLRATLKLAIERLHLFSESHISRRKMQSKYLRQIRDLYSSEFHVVCMPLQSTEVRGTENLRNFADLLRSPKQLPIIKECP